MATGCSSTPYTSTIVVVEILEVLQPNATAETWDGSSWTET